MITTGWLTVILMGLLITIVILVLTRLNLSNEDDTTFSTFQTSDANEEDFNVDVETPPSNIVSPTPGITVVGAAASTTPVRFDTDYFLYAFQPTTSRFELVRGDAFVSIDPIFDPLQIQLRSLSRDDNRLLTNGTRCRLYVSSEDTFLTTLDNPITSPLATTSTSSGWGIEYEVFFEGGDNVALLENTPLVFSVRSSSFFTEANATQSVVLKSTSSTLESYLFHTQETTNVSQEVFLLSTTLVDHFDAA